MIYYCRERVPLEPDEIPEAEPPHRTCRNCASLLRSARNGGIDAESLCYGGE